MNLVNRADAEQAFAELCVSATATALMRLCNNLDSIWTTFRLTVSNRRHGHDCCLSSFAVSDSPSMTVNITSEMLLNALRR